MYENEERTRTYLQKEIVRLTSVVQHIQISGSVTNTLKDQLAAASVPVAGELESVGQTILGRVCGLLAPINIGYRSSFHAKWGKAAATVYAEYLFHFWASVEASAPAFREMAWLFNLELRESRMFSSHTEKSKK